MSTNPWEAVMAAVTKLRERVDTAPQAREAGVADLDPLSVLFDTDSTPTLVTGNLQQGLQVGDRVLTMRVRHYIWILGVKGGVNQYDVGDIYITTSKTSAEAVQAKYGGTWVAWGSGRVPVGVDTEQTEFNTIEKTGGEKTHLLTAAELPKSLASDPILVPTVNVDGGGTSGYGTNNRAYLAIGGSPYTQLDNSAGGSHNNLQPYITVYMWKRTA